MPNPLHKFAVNKCGKHRFNPERSLTLSFQNQSPSKANSAVLGAKDCASVTACQRQSVRSRQSRLLPQTVTRRCKCPLGWTTAVWGRLLPYEVVGPLAAPGQHRCGMDHRGTDARRLEGACRGEDERPAFATHNQLHLKGAADLCPSAMRRSHPAARSRPARPLPATPAAATQRQRTSQSVVVRVSEQTLAGGTREHVGSEQSERRCAGTVEES